MLSDDAARPPDPENLALQIQVPERREEELLRMW
jgi:hypothetical protein